MKTLYFITILIVNNKGCILLEIIDILQAGLLDSSSGALINFQVIKADEVNKHL